MSERRKEAYFEEETINYIDYYRSIRRHLLGIFLFSISITVISAYLIQFIPDVYKADTSIFIETKESNLVSIEGMYRVDMGENEYFNTQISMLKSRSLSKNVFDELELNQQQSLLLDDSKRKSFLVNLKASLPDFIKSLFQKYFSDAIAQYSNDPKVMQEEYFQQFRNNINVSRIENSNLIRISFETQIKELAAKVPNKLAELYIQGGLQNKSEDNQQALTILSERVSSLKTQLMESEQKLFAYRNEHNLLDTGGRSSLESQSIEVISGELFDARKERTEIEIIYQQLKLINNPSIEQYESMPWIMENSSIQNARNEASRMQSNVIELSKTYGIKHPRIQSALSQYKKAKMNYAEILSGVVTGIIKKYRAALLYEKELKQDLSNIKNDIRNINKKSYQLRLLEKEVEENSSLLETFSSRLKESRETATIDNVATATIVDKAIIPAEPFFPKRKLFVIAAFILTLFVGSIVALVTEAMIKTFRFPEEIEKKLNVPFLGLLPQLKKKQSKKTVILPYLEDKKSHYAESIRTIRTGILLSLVKEKKKNIILTSSIPSEGKTTASLNLAIAMGKTQKVLIIDTDMRKSTIARKCGIETEIGLSTLLTGRSQLEESIHRFEEWEIDVLPGGEVSTHPQELLCSDAFSQLLDTLNDHYDFIIIDSAPIAPVADTLLLTNIVKNIVFVVKAESTSSAMARSSIDKLKSIDANIIGIILNELDVSKAAKYKPDDYYGGYYDDYGYNS